MARKLPLTHAKPAVDAVRKRLGGRASTDPDAGEIVTVETDSGIDRVGVVVFAKGEQVDVWTDSGIPMGGVVRRLHRSRTRRARGPIPEGLSAVARDATAFAALPEGVRVRFQQEGGVVEEATLVEKCRYGAVVLRDDGTLVGVGFRRVWRVAAGARSTPSEAN